MNWILNRLKEPSTWRGIIGMAGLFGLALSPEMKEQIVMVAVGLMTMIEIIRKEKHEPVNEVADAKETTTQIISTTEATAEQRAAIDNP